MEFLLVANPENRRATFFREAVERRGDRCRVISWLEVLAGADVSADLVRIESPGENWQVESALLGRYEPEDLGRIRGIDVAYHRFVEVLQRFEASRFMNTPSAIAAMFDKVTTKQRLHRAGVAVPQGYGLVRTFEELRDVVGRSGRVRFFVRRLTTFEVNAFGDLLPGVVDARGRSTYEAELDAFSLTA